MVEGNIELARDEASGGGGRSVKVDIGGFKRAYEREQGVAEVREEAIVLVGDSTGEDVVTGKEVRVVDVEGREFVVTHGVDLFNVRELRLCRLGITIRARRGRELDILCEAVKASDEASRVTNAYPRFEEELKTLHYFLTCGILDSRHVANALIPAFATRSTACTTIFLCLACIIVQGERVYRAIRIRSWRRLAILCGKWDTTGRKGGTRTTSRRWGNVAIHGIQRVHNHP